MKLIILLLIIYGAAGSLIGSKPTCVLSLQIGTKKDPVGIMGGIHLAYKTGFNAVFVPIQKTGDAFPRMVVSTDPMISGQTMLQISQKGGPIHLLGEFLGITSNMVEILLMMVQHPNDVDMIVHEIGQTSRGTSSFVLVIPPQLAEVQKDKSDALSRYRSLVPDGKSLIYFEDYRKSYEEIFKILGIAKKSGVDLIAVPAGEIDETLVIQSKLHGIAVGAFNVDTETEMRTIMNSTVAFFTTRNPWAYLSLTVPKNKIPVVKSHAAVFLG